MTPKEGKFTIKIHNYMIKKILCLETSTKRRSSSDTLTAANMKLYIRGPSPCITGVSSRCFQSFLILI